MLKPASGSYKVHKHTHTKTHTHIFLCLVAIQSCCMLQSSNTIGAPFLFVFVLFCFLLYIRPTHPSTHPPIHLPSSLHFFWLDHTMRKHNQSWLAGFFRGGSCTHVLCFSKKLKKKVRYCSSTSSLVSQKCRRCSNNITH
jgi:hypothetical protein